MKRTFSVFVVLLMLFMLPSISLGYNKMGPYISGQLGVSSLTDSDVSINGHDLGSIEYDPGFASSFAAGFNFGMFRIEGEFGYQGNNVDYKYDDYYDDDYYDDDYYDDDYYDDDYYDDDENDMNAYSFMGNFYLDFVNPSPVTPFITAGIGMANVELFDADDTVLAYQVGAGLAFAINPHMSIDVKYRYFATEDLDLEGYDVEFASHNVYCGFRFTF